MINKLSINLKIYELFDFNL